MPETAVSEEGAVLTGRGDGDWNHENLGLERQRRSGVGGLSGHAAGEREKQKKTWRK